MGTGWDRPLWSVLNYWLSCFPLSIQTSRFIILRHLTLYTSYIEDQVSVLIPKWQYLFTFTSSQAILPCLICYHLVWLFLWKVLNNSELFRMCQRWNFSQKIIHLSLPRWRSSHSLWKQVAGKTTTLLLRD